MEVQANIADRVGVMYVAKFVDEGLSMTFSTIINTKDPLAGIQRFRKALNYLFEYVLDQGYAAAQQAQVRPEGQAQRSAWRHLFPHHRRVSGLHRDSGTPGDGRRQPGGRLQARGRPQLTARRGVGLGCGHVLPYHPQRSKLRAF